MKQLIAILLLIIVGATAVTPCCLYDDCAQEQRAATPAPPDGGAQEGTCSPFSSCATCFGFTTEVPGVQVAAPPTAAPEHRSLEAIPSLPNVSFSFWQPPRRAALPC